MQSLIDFETEQPLATRFFTQALNGHFVNATILQGRDYATMYRIALRLAQILNCTEKSNVTTACGQCQSCRWIGDNAHPGVITVSNLTYRPEGETLKSKSKTGQQAILVNQLETLLKELSLHSGGFHRVIILVGAEEIAPSEPTLATHFMPPAEWLATHDANTLQWQPLDRRVFPDRLANKFLKTLEEPPNDTLFFLITDNESKLLETIVSRCQLVPFITPKALLEPAVSVTQQAVFDRLLQSIPQGAFLELVQQVSAASNEAALSTETFLTQFQAFLWVKLRQMPDQREAIDRFSDYLAKIEHTKRQLRDHVREDAALEDLFLQLAHYDSSMAIKQ